MPVPTPDPQTVVIPCTDCGKPTPAYETTDPTTVRCVGCGFDQMYGSRCDCGETKVGATSWGSCLCGGSIDGEVQ